MHDFNPGIGSNGLFWIVQVPDDAIKVDDEKGTLTISLKDVPIVDQFSFPNGAGNNLGAAGVPATASFDITYTKVEGTRRHIRPTSTDPLSPFDWAGEMWMATNSGTFSVAYKDGSFSAQGSFSSAGNFGEMGTERNGSFVRREDREDGDRDDDGESGQGEKAMAGLASTSEAGGQPSASATQSANSPRWRGKVSVESFVH